MRSRGSECWRESGGRRPLLCGRLLEVRIKLYCENMYVLYIGVFRIDGEDKNVSAVSRTYRYDL